MWELTCAVLQPAVTLDGVNRFCKGFVCGVNIDSCNCC